MGTRTQKKSEDTLVVSKPRGFYCFYMCFVAAMMGVEIIVLGPFVLRSLHQTCLCRGGGSGHNFAVLYLLCDHEHPGFGGGGGGGGSANAAEEEDRIGEIKKSEWCGNLQSHA